MSTTDALLQEAQTKLNTLLLDIQTPSKAITLEQGLEQLVELVADAQTQLMLDIADAVERGIAIAMSENTGLY